MKFRTLIKNHYPALILAAILGLLMILPFFYFQIKLGADFKGVWPVVVDDESFYLTRIKDVIDGHSFLSNAYLVEHKDGLPQQLFLAEWLLAQPLKLFNIDINTGRLIYNFLFSAAAFLLTYIALFLISRSRLIAAGLAGFLFFGLYMTSFIRPVSPQFNFIFWLTQFIFLYILVENPNSRRLLLLNLLNFGLLFYIYPYYWTFYLIFFGLLAVFYFWSQRALFYKILMIAGGGLILAIPYFYLNYLSSKLPYYLETLTRLGMIYTRFPSGIRIVFWSSLGLVAFWLLLWRKIISWDGKSIFFISGLLASVIAVNQHIITGRNLEFSSHYSMGALFFAVFAAAYLWNKRGLTQIETDQRGNFQHKFALNPRLSAILVIVVLAAVSIIAVFGLYAYTKRSLVIYENHVYRQNYAPIFDWLNKNTEKDSVVYANKELSRLIPVYTANNIYYVREANLFFISDEEVLDRFILNNFFERFDEDFVTENVRSVYGVRYIDAYGHAVQGNKLRRLLGLELEPEVYLPDEAIAKIIARAAVLQKGVFGNEIKKYQLDFLVWDRTKNPNWRIDERKFKKAFVSGDINVFQPF